MTVLQSTSAELININCLLDLGLESCKLVGAKTESLELQTFKQAMEEFLKTIKEKNKKIILMIEDADNQ